MLASRYMDIIELVVYCSSLPTNFPNSLGASFPNPEQKHRSKEGKKECIWLLRFPVVEKQCNSLVSNKILNLNLFLPQANTDD